MMKRGETKKRHILAAFFLAAVFAAPLPAHAVGPYTDNGDGTVTDQGTGLVWMRDTPDRDDDGFPDPMGWSEAIGYCEGLEFAGHGDWRLPNIQELRSIVKYDTHDPAIDTSVFSARSEFYWSSTSVVSDPENAWGVDFGSGYDRWDFKSFKYSKYARCVRGRLFPIVTGDANGDGVVDLRDAVTVARLLVGLDPGPVTVAASVADGPFSTADLVFILRRIAESPAGT